MKGEATTGSGVSGHSESGNGIYATSTTGHAVNTFSKSGSGVFAVNGAAAVSALWAPRSPAVQGCSGTRQVPRPPPGGPHRQDRCVRLRGPGRCGDRRARCSPAGRGVQGETTSGFGVRAAATTGYGVYVTTTSGTGGDFGTGGPKTGTALRTVGRVRFDNSVGIATIALGASSVTVTPGIDLTATSAVVATLQGSAGGTTSVRYLTVNATADTFTIYLTAKTTAAVKVAWHVFG